MRARSAYTFMPRIVESKTCPSDSGHYIQSQKSGFMYLSKYGIPSLVDYLSNKGEKVFYHQVSIEKHHTYWAEIDADKRAADYFIGNGYMTIWKYERKYPTY